MHLYEFTEALSFVTIMLALSLEELVTPVTEALVAIGRLFVVGSGEILRIGLKLDSEMNNLL